MFHHHCNINDYITIIYNLVVYSYYELSAKRVRDLSQIMLALRFGGGLDKSVFCDIKVIIFLKIIFFWGGG